MLVAELYAWLGPETSCLLMWALCFLMPVLRYLLYRCDLKKQKKEEEISNLIERIQMWGNFWAPISVAVMGKPARILAEAYKRWGYKWNWWVPPREAMALTGLFPIGKLDDVQVGLKWNLYTNLFGRVVRVEGVIDGVSEPELRARLQTEYDKLMQSSKRKLTHAGGRINSMESR
jgi:hypothetical protein